MKTPAFVVGMPVILTEPIAAWNLILENTRIGLVCAVKNDSICVDWPHLTNGHAGPFRTTIPNKRSCWWSAGHELRPVYLHFEHLFPKES